MVCHGRLQLSPMHDKLIKEQYLKEVLPVTVQQYSYQG